MQRFRTFMLPVMAAAAIGATPVMAADYFPTQTYVREAPIMRPPGGFSLQQALAVAADVGVVTVSNTHLDGDEWEIEGRDSYGKWIQVDVDARTGEVRNVDRSIL